MKSIISGGGKVGYNLLKVLKERKYNVTLIDSDKNKCEKIAEDCNLEIFWGDGTDIEVLKEAGIKKADVVVAVTGSDEVNFTVCQLAKMNFNVNTLARVKNPKNVSVFQSLGIDHTVCITEDIIQLITQ